MVTIGRARPFVAGPRVFVVVRGKDRDREEVHGDKRGDEHIDLSPEEPSAHRLKGEGGQRDGADGRHGAERERDVPLAQHRGDEPAEREKREQLPQLRGRDERQPGDEPEQPRHQGRIGKRQVPALPVVLGDEVMGVHIAAGRAHAFAGPVIDLEVHGDAEQVVRIRGAGGRVRLVF